MVVKYFNTKRQEQNFNFAPAVFMEKSKKFFLFEIKIFRGGDA